MTLVIVSLRTYFFLLVIKKFLQQDPKAKQDPKDLV